MEKNQDLYQLCLLASFMAIAMKTERIQLAAAFVMAGDRPRPLESMTNRSDPLSAPDRQPIGATPPLFAPPFLVNPCKAGPPQPAGFPQTPAPSGSTPGNRAAEKSTPHQRSLSALPGVQRPGPPRLPLSPPGANGIKPEQRSLPSNSLSSTRKGGLLWGSRPGPNIAIAAPSERAGGFSLPGAPKPSGFDHTTRLASRLPRPIWSAGVPQPLSRRLPGPLFPGLLRFRIGFDRHRARGLPNNAQALKQGANAPQGVVNPGRSAPPIPGPRADSESPLQRPGCAPGPIARASGRGGGPPGFPSGAAGWRQYRPGDTSSATGIGCGDAHQQPEPFPEGKALSAVTRERTSESVTQCPFLPGRVDAAFPLS